MIYTDNNTIQTIKKKSKQIVKDCEIALSLIDKVQATILQFVDKSITGNKARLTKAIKEIDNNLIVLINWDDYNGADLQIYYLGQHSEHYYLDWGKWEKDNIIKADSICQQFAHGKKNLEMHKARAIYTATHAKTIINKHKKCCDILNAIQSDCLRDLLEIAGIKQTYYM